MVLTRAIFKLKKSFWFLPAYYSFVAFVMAFLSHQADLYVNQSATPFHIPYFFLTRIDHSIAILSALVTAMLTMTTITFSSVLVVLTTYSSEFSPRTLQNFITQQKTQRVLGIFIGSFIYILIILLTIKDTGLVYLISPTFAVFITIISLAFFVYYVHYIATSIQVSNLIDQITSNIIKAIDINYPDNQGNAAEIEAPWESWESEEVKQYNPNFLAAPKTGYIQWMNKERMIALAKDFDVILKSERSVGEYVIEGTTLFTYWKQLEPMEENILLENVTIGIERAPIQDIRFGIQKLVEIAIRALSPGINDPNTAVVCINELGKVLSYLGKKQMPSPYYYDENANLRLIIHHEDFFSYLYTSFYQIKIYGSNDLGVLASTIETLTMIADNNNKKIKDMVWKFSQYIITGCKQNFHDYDCQFINQRLMRLASTTGHIKQYQPVEQTVDKK